MKTCTKCGEVKPLSEFHKNKSKKDGHNSQCSSCVKAAGAAYYKANIEKVAVRGAVYREENKDEIARRSAAYYAANKDKAAEYQQENREKIAARMAIWREKNKDRIAEYREEMRNHIIAYNVAYRKANKTKCAAYRAQYRAENPEKCKELEARWRTSNLDKCRIKLHNYRARKRTNGGSLSRGLAERLFKLQRGKCACGCGQPLGTDYHLDHIMPVALGGTNTDDNIQLLTATCNMQKSAKHPVDFMQQRGFLL